jgi:tyrosyl-tRNA synthetase
MLMGLGEPPKTEGKDATERTIDLKMSKSKPDTAVFMTDSEEDVKRKMKKAWCPEGQIEENPVLEYFKYIIFEKFDTVMIERPEKYGGNVELTSYADLEHKFKAKEIHPMDVKTCAATYIEMIVRPVRDAILNDSHLKKLREEIKSFEVTR